MNKAILHLVFEDNKQNRRITVEEISYTDNNDLMNSISESIKNKSNALDNQALVFSNLIK